MMRRNPSRSVRHKNKKHNKRSTSFDVLSEGAIPLTQHMFKTDKKENLLKLNHHKTTDPMYLSGTSSYHLGDSMIKDQQTQEQESSMKQGTADHSFVDMQRPTDANSEGNAQGNFLQEEKKKENGNGDDSGFNFIWKSIVNYVVSGEAETLNPEELEASLM
jgi:hypothetical protein